jgi:ribosomal protein S18 acetylase RimI-like enzyme
VSTLAVKVRDIKATDKAGIIKIVEDTKAFLPEEVEVAEEIIDEYFKDPEGSGYYFYVAEIDGEMAGYLCYGPTPLTHGAWDMYWAAVKPQLQGTGIGGTLFKMAEERIKKLGGRMILIETSSNPHYGSARSLYLKLGYEHVSTIPDFYSPGDSKETFRKLI